MQISPKVIGVMRFSVLTPTYYSERFDSIEAIAAHIYSDERMALRFHIFENLVLPSLMRQTDTDFDLVVLTGEAMPDKYKVRLASLLSLAPNLHMQTVGTDRHYQLLRGGYDSIPLQGATHRLMFRLDDDDAVDIEFVERLKRIAGSLATLQGADIPQVIAFNRGFYVRRVEGAENEVFDACERAPLSAGLALLAPAEYVRNPYRYNHRAIAQHYNTYTDITVPGFIRTIHGDNKSNPTQMGPHHRMRPKVMDRQLRAHFDLTLDTLKGL